MSPPPCGVVGAWHWEGPGFGPAAEVLFFREKDPKPCWPCHGPSGALRGSPTPAASKLAALKHCPPFLRCRLHCSTMPQGQGSPEEKGGPTRRAQTRSTYFGECQHDWPTCRWWSEGKGGFEWKGGEIKTNDEVRRIGAVGKSLRIADNTA